MDDLALSALDWWQEAGVDTLVDEAPRNWLAPPAAPAARPVAQAAPTPPLPADLPAFRKWLLNDPLLPGAPAARLDAMGDPATGIFILADMPDTGDRVGRRLLGGDVGALFDRMLAAMKLDRHAIYLAPFAPARPPSGRLDAEACRLLADLARHHLGLVKPKRLLLLGDAPVRALTGENLLAARGRTLTIDHPGGSVPAIASFHPRYVRDQPSHRAEAWADLQRFMALA